MIERCRPAEVIDRARAWRCLGLVRCRERRVRAGRAAASRTALGETVTNGGVLEGATSGKTATGGVETAAGDEVGGRLGEASTGTNGAGGRMASSRCRMSSSIGVLEGRTAFATS